MLPWHSSATADQYSSPHWSVSFPWRHTSARERETNEKRLNSCSKSQSDIYSSRASLHRSSSRWTTKCWSYRCAHRRRFFLSQQRLGSSDCLFPNPEELSHVHWPDQTGESEFRGKENERMAIDNFCQLIFDISLAEEKESVLRHGQVPSLSQLRFRSIFPLVFFSSHAYIRA